MSRPGGVVSVYKVSLLPPKQLQQTRHLLDQLSWPEHTLTPSNHRNTQSVREEYGNGYDDSSRLIQTGPPVFVLVHPTHILVTAKHSIHRSQSTLDSATQPPASSHNLSTSTLSQFHPAISLETPTGRATSAAPT